MSGELTRVRRTRGRAVVVGASMAGLFAARVLADLVDEVVVLEREHLVDRPEPRGHVPQGRHVHVLLNAARQRMDGWFPGVSESLVAQGASDVDGTRALWFQAGGYRKQGSWGGTTLSMSRPLLELEVRRRVRALPNVVMRDGAHVERLLTAGRHVRGVRADGVEWPADLVVDCSGRHSKLAHDLADTGVLVPPVSTVTVDLSYATRLFRRSPSGAELPGSFVVIPGDPPRNGRAAVAFPIEGDRWMVTLAGRGGDAPPTDEAGWRAFAETLSSPVVAGLIDRAESLTPVMSYRFPASQRRHYERLDNLLPGFVVLGDAVSSFNPVYGQGISSAALQAEKLGAVVRDLGLCNPDLPQDFHQRIGKIVDVPWTISVGADFLDPATTGPKPRGTDQVNAYIGRVILAAQVSDEVATAMTRVQGLDVPPTSLMRPRMLLTVLRQARTAPGRSAAPVTHPVSTAPLVTTGSFRAG